MALIMSSESRDIFVAAANTASGRYSLVDLEMVCANVVGLMGPSLYLNFEITITFMLMAHYMGNNL